MMSVRSELAVNTASAIDDVANILIVDDRPENLLALNALIRGDNRRVFQAASGEAALDLLLLHEFGLALLDVQMPGMNGFELAEAMRSTDKTRHIPIIFVTAAGPEQNHAFKGYGTGAVDFLYKPLDMDAVRSKVQVFVELHLQRRAARRQVEALEKIRQEQRALLEELQVAQEELRGAVRMRDDFMAMAAHELRTPLNTLMLEGRLRKMQLERGQAAKFDAAYLEAMVARDQRQVGSMVRLIDDMMDASRLRSNRLSIQPAPVELYGLLSRVVSDLCGQASAAGCQITLSPGGPVTGLWDEFRLEQVIVNLLTNALRYGNGKPVEVRLIHEVDGVRIDVEDQGRGISEAEQSRVFEQFSRIVGNDGTGGLGLGLFITQQLVHAHGGRVSVTSRLGEGSVFSVALPLAAPAETAF